VMSGVMSRSHPRIWVGRQQSLGIVATASGHLDGRTLDDTIHGVAIWRPWGGKDKEP
jgi:hypothetical protein